MTNKVTEQIERMKEQTIGVEVEMNGISRRRASEIAAEYFGTHNEFTAYRNGYDTWSAYDAQNREWKFMRDVSIHSDDDYKKCELVTPILKYEDIETLQELLRRLRKHGARSHAGIGCGVHIHIGAAGHTPQTIRNLVNIMASHETLIAEAIKIDAGRQNHYCKVIDPDFLARINTTKPKTMAALATTWYTGNHATYGIHEHYNDSRYHMLNLHATFTKGTIEFRLFQFDKPEEHKRNGIHAGQLKAYIQLCMAMSQMAKEVKTASPKKQQHENPKFAMRTWLNRLGLIGDEFKTAREFLTKNLTGNAAWRNRVA